LNAVETADLELELEPESESSLESSLELELELELDSERELRESSDELLELEELEVVEVSAVTVWAAILPVLAALSMSCAWWRCATAWWAMLKCAGVTRPSRLSHKRTASRIRRRLPRNRAASLAKSDLTSFPGNFIDSLHDSKVVHAPTKSLPIEPTASAGPRPCDPSRPPGVLTLWVRPYM
jgi:hypothetical protein